MAVSQVVFNYVNYRDARFPNVGVYFVFSGHGFLVQKEDYANNLSWIYKELEKIWSILRFHLYF